MEKIIQKMKTLIIETDDEKLIPKNAKPEDAGYDLMANNGGIILQPGETTLIGTGIKIQIPIGYEAQIRPRSGLAIKHGITILNSPGTIDSGYRGEIGIILHNAGKDLFEIEKYDRIAQMVINKIEQPTIIVGKVDTTDRGTDGFGSTGK